MIAVGSNTITSAYLGDKVIKSIYFGTNELFSDISYDEEVEYIESSGTQYINTRFNPTYKTRVVIDMQALTTGSTACFVGSRDEHSMQSENQYVLLQTSSVPLRSDYFGGTNVTISNVNMTQRTIIDKNVNKVVVGGSTYSHAAVTSGLGSWPLYVFGLNDLGTPYVLSSMRLYSMKIYDDNVLVRDFIPVRVGEEGALFDKVEGKLYTNAGTGSFSYHSYYDSEIEYLESSGTQYINTGHNPTYQARVVADMQSTADSNAKIFFGTRDRDGSNASNQFVLMQSYPAIRTDYFGTAVSTSSNSLTTRTVVDKNANVTKLYDKTYTNTAVSSGVVPYPLYIFALNNVGNMVYGSSMKLYSMQIYDNNALIRDFIPVRVGTEGCLYDKVEKRIYRNAGTGTFVLGADK